MNNNVLLGGRVFVAGVAFGALIAASGSVLAGYRVLPGELCHRVNSVATVFGCGLPTGSDFPSSGINAIEVAFYHIATQPDTIRAVACREAWNGFDQGCGTTDKIDLAGNSVPKNELLYPGTAGVKGGNKYDYRWVDIWTEKPNYIRLKGMYVGNGSGT